MIIIPHTLEQGQRLMADLQGRCRVPVQLLIDAGHAREARRAEATRLDRTATEGPDRVTR